MIPRGPALPEGTVPFAEEVLEAAGAEALAIQGGMSYAGVSVKANAGLAVGTEDWGKVNVKADDVMVEDASVIITVPANAEKGFMALDSKAFVGRISKDIPLAETSGLALNGHVSADLRELCAAGCVALSEGLNPSTGKPARETRYRMRDNYIRFYLKFIRPKQAAIRSGMYKFKSMEDLAGRLVGHSTPLRGIERPTNFVRSPDRVNATFGRLNATDSE